MLIVIMMLLEPTDSLDFPIGDELAACLGTTANARVKHKGGERGKNDVFVAEDITKSAKEEEYYRTIVLASGHTEDVISDELTP